MKMLSAILLGLVALPIWAQQGQLNENDQNQQNNQIDADTVIIYNRFDSGLKINELVSPLPMGLPGQPEIYQDFLESCKRALDTMMLNYNLAKDEWHYGNQLSAVRTLTHALNAEYAKLQTVKGWDIPPHTAVAIAKAKQITVDTFPIIDKRLPLNLHERLSINLTVKYILLTQLIELIGDTYANLDQPYYRTMVQDYYQRPDVNIPYEWPFESPQGKAGMPYFDSLKKLALNFINVQSGIATYLADDYVELVSTRSFAQAGRELLAKSVLRRSFCRPIRKLRVLEMLMDYYMQGGTSVPSSFRVRNARMYLQDIKNDIRNLSPERCQ